MSDDEAPIGQLSPQPWLSAPETQAVVKALTAEGAEIRFVGGCVRDALAHRPVKDVDIATALKPNEVIALLKKAGLKAVPTGIDHGTVTAVSGGKAFEVTTLRRDRVCDGRRAEVEFTDDWKADAARRDLTINALSARPDGAVYDYFNGIDHLAQGLIRFIGLPKRRLEEDYLRILRYFRFLAHYGQRGPNREALAAIRVAAPELATLSGERVRNEMLRLFEADSVADILLHMQAVKVLDQVLPEAENFGRLRVLCWLETKAIKVQGVEPDNLRRLASVLSGPGTTEAQEQVKAIAKRYKLANKQKSRLLAIAKAPDLPAAHWDEHASRRFLRKVKAETYTDLVLIQWAARKAVVGRTDSAETEAWLNLLGLAGHWTPPDFPLTGNDVQSLGIAKGPEVGRLLAELEHWWEEEKYVPAREALLARLKERLL